MGRSRLPESEVRSAIGIRVSDKFALSLDMVAFDLGFHSRSDTIRHALGQFCNRYFEENGGVEAVTERYKAARVQELEAQLSALRQPTE